MIFFFEITGGMILIFLIVAFGVATSEGMLDILRVIGGLIGMAAILFEALGIIACLSSGRTIFSKVWKSVLLAGICYCTEQQMELYVRFIMDRFNQGSFSFLDGAIGGSIQYFAIIISAFVATMAIGGGYREGPISCILGTIFFVFVNSWANKEGIQCLVRALDGEKKIILIGLLGGSLICTVGNKIIKVYRKSKKYKKQNFVKEKKINRIMYCAKCGKKLEENEKFCTACGRPVARKKQIENNSKK